MNPLRALGSAGLALALALGCGGAASTPRPAPAPPASPSASMALAAGAPLAEAPCRPLIRGKLDSPERTQAALEKFFNDISSEQEGHNPAQENSSISPSAVSEIQRLRACPTSYDVTFERTPGLTSGTLVFEEPELGSLEVSFIVRDSSPAGGRRELLLDPQSLEQSFHESRARAELLPFLERSPEWIPSGTTCWSYRNPDATSVALFRSARANVLCAARGDKKRCFSFEPNPSGWVFLEMHPEKPPKPACGVGNAIFSAELELRVTPFGGPKGEPRLVIRNVGAAPDDQPRASRALPKKWVEVDAAPFPVRAAADLREASRVAVGAAAPPAIVGNGMSCLRLDGAWRCTLEHLLWEVSEKMQVRSADGKTIVSFANAIHEPGSGVFETSRFVTLLGGEGTRLVTLARFPAGTTNVNVPAEGEHTELAQVWEVAHETALCLRVSRAYAYRRLYKDEPGFKWREQPAPLVYGPAPTSIGRMAPRLEAPAPFEPQRPVADLRGSWRLDGEAWLRSPSCKAP